MAETKILLDESEIPEQWYNIVADMPNPPLTELNSYTVFCYVRQVHTIIRGHPERTGT